MTEKVFSEARKQKKVCLIRSDVSEVMPKIVHEKFGSENPSLTDPMVFSLLAIFWEMFEHHESLL